MEMAFKLHSTPCLPKNYRYFHAKANKVISVPRNLLHWERKEITNAFFPLSTNFLPFNHGPNPLVFAWRSRNFPPLLRSTEPFSWPNKSRNSSFTQCWGRKTISRRAQLWSAHPYCLESRKHLQLTLLFHAEHCSVANYHVNTRPFPSSLGCSLAQQASDCNVNRKLLLSLYV